MSLPMDVTVDTFSNTEFTITQEEIANFPLMWRLTKDEQLKVVSFNVFTRPSKNVSVLFITSDDSVYGMGENGHEVNILAMEGYNFRCDLVSRPIRVEGLSGKRIKSFNIGGVIGAAMDVEGLLYWWGKDVTWRIDDIILPDKPGYDTKFTRFCCGYAMLAAIDIEGFVHVWGPYDYGSNNYRFMDIYKFEHPVVSLSCGYSHLAMVSGGQVYTCGVGSHGQRGFSSYSVISRDIKQKLELEEPCKSVACGPFSTFMVTSSGKLWACGANYGQFGYLGVASKEYSIKTPEKVVLNTNVKHVLTLWDPLDYCTCIAITDDGLYSWNGEGLGIPRKVNGGDAQNVISSMYPKNIMIRVQQPCPPGSLTVTLKLLGKLELASQLVLDLQLELEKLKNESLDTGNAESIGTSTLVDT